MMDASLPADQSGLSDLSAASIVSKDDYLDSTSPTPDQQKEVATPMPTSSRMFTTPHVNATPGPSRLRMEQPDTPPAVWTPSPDASSSRSKSNSRSMQRAPSRGSSGKGNESVGSTLGSFDYSNASFSESFLRQAGAHMLAGLDEADIPPAQSSSSSPRYRTSSSPTVTARPIRAADPRTPFTGKSLRTRMAEAGMLDSPASSDGSSPSSSPTTRMLPDSYTRTVLVSSRDAEELSPGSNLESPNARSFLQPYSPSLDSSAYGNFEAASQQATPTSRDDFGIEEEHDWQEGLSMVPEESYVEDASQSPASPALRGDSLQCPTIPDAQLSQGRLRKGSPQPSTEDSHPSLASSDQPSEPREDQVPADPLLPLESTDGEDNEDSQQMQLLDRQPEHSFDKLDSRSAAQSTPSPRKPSPPTPSRPLNTPKSFARLRIGTPVRSSPLAREINFSPSSAGSNASQWQSPASQKGSSYPAVASPMHTEGQSPVSAPFQQATQSSLPPTGLFDATESERSSHPQTPHAAFSAQSVSGTPSQLWSPATSASFATPASQRPQFSAPTTPNYPLRIPADAFSTPANDFGTPQWSPSPASLPANAVPVPIETERTQAENSIEAPQDDDEEEIASSSASVGSERKQSGDVSTASQSVPDVNIDPKISPLSARSNKKLDLSFASPTQQLESPSAAKFSRLQLTRMSPPTSLPPELASVPEFGVVAAAFDSLNQLSDSRVSRLLSQLSASTARIEELEAALEARDAEREALQDVRLTLSQLSSQYEELIQEADEKDVSVVETIKRMQNQLQRGGGVGARDLEHQLDEEKRLREVERRDYEVRIQGLLASATNSSGLVMAQVANTAAGSEDQMRAAVEQAKEQLRLTLEKDFEIRRAMEQRELQARVGELERELAASVARNSNGADGSTEDQDQSELQRQVEQLTSELDRRFEELTDLREELEAAVIEKESAERRALTVEEELHEARSQSHHSRDSTNDQTNEELDELRTILSERDMHISRLEETLSLTTSRVAALTAERDAVSRQQGLAAQSESDSSTRIAQLESHILTLETQLRTRTPSKPASSLAYDAESARTPGDRLSQLQKELATLQLDLVKMGRANDALQEDNVNFSIALSAKQLELGMVKRNARFALKNARAQMQAREDERVGLPLSKTAEKAIEFPVVPQGKFGEKDEAGLETGKGKENGGGEVNKARMQARQMLAQRRTAPNVSGGATRQRTLLAA